MTRVVITGPTGAIGLALINYYMAKNVEVIAICRENSSRISHIPQGENVKIYECNLENICDFNINLECDVFFHLGWDGTIGPGRNDIMVQSKNVEYAIECVRLAKRLKCKKFVGIGSQAEYGIQNSKLSSDMPVNPQTAYGAAKCCASLLTRMEAENLGMEQCWARVLSVYGPGDGNRTLISSVITGLLEDNRVPLTEGIQKWDYLYSGDAAKLLDLIACKGRHGEVYVLGSGSERPLREYVDIIAKELDRKELLDYGKIPYGAQSVMYLCADTLKLTEELGFTDFVPFEIGIKDTIEWIKMRETQ